MKYGITFWFYVAQRSRKNTFLGLDRRGHSHSRRRESTFSVRVVKYCKKLTVSVTSALYVNNFKEMLETFWTEVFPFLPHWLDAHLPNLLLPAYHQLTATISICYPTPCFVYVVSSGPQWPFVYHVNHYHNQMKHSHQNMLFYLPCTTKHEPVSFLSKWTDTNTSMYGKT